MELFGLHVLLTYQCNFECDHCFTWGSPHQSGTLTLNAIQQALEQARELGSVEWIYFEGGEPFLYYPVLLKKVRDAARMGFKVGIVSNAYWATDPDDALEWLRPFAGLLQNLTISSDLYHYSEKLSRQARCASQAASQLGIPPVGVLSVAQPELPDAASAVGQPTSEDSPIMYRGRAAEKLAAQTRHRPWTGFTSCPHEDLRDPRRVHMDPLGNLHLCQGISLGNLFVTPLREICATYDPASHPVAGPLLAGGPAELVRRYDLPYRDDFADACHLCYRAREGLRARFPDVLVPDQMYGVFNA